MSDIGAHGARWARVVAFVAAVLLSVFLAAPHAQQAYASEAEPAQASLGSMFDSVVNVEFYVAVVKEGTDSYPQSMEELQGVLTGAYSPGIRMDDALDASGFLQFGGDQYLWELYDLSGETIDGLLLKKPTEEEIAEACRRGGIDFDPETQTVVWYVVKSAISVFDTVWHVDGLLVPKEIAPDYDGSDGSGDSDDSSGQDSDSTPNPDEPENPDQPVDPDEPENPDQPDGSGDSDDATDPDEPENPDQPVDPDEPENPDGSDPDSDSDGSVDDDSGNSGETGPDESVDSEVPENPDDSLDSEDSTTSDSHDSSEAVPGDSSNAGDTAKDESVHNEAEGAKDTSSAMAREAEQDTSTGGSSQNAGNSAAAPTSDSLPPLIAEADAAEPSVQSVEPSETPLAHAPSSQPGEAGALSGALPAAANAALHVAGAVGLASVALGVVASNIALAHAGQGLSSLDSRLRQRGGRRRR